MSVGTLGVVVVNYGSSRLLAGNLVPLTTALPDAAIVVVDNATTAEELDRVRSLAAAHGWTVEESPVNVGFGAAVDRGATRAFALGADRILVLNPDVEIDPATVEDLATRVSPSLALTPRLERPDGSTWFAGGQLDRRRGLTTSREDRDQVGPDRWITAACLLVHRRPWDAVGGFDPRYFLYWEDVDLTQRLLDAGCEVKVAHDLRARHDVGGTQAGTTKSALYVRYMCRNRLLFASTHVSPADRLRWIANAPRYAWRVLCRDGRRRALRDPRRIWAALAGTAAGVRLVLRG